MPTTLAIQTTNRTQTAPGLDNQARKSAPRVDPRFRSLLSAEQWAMLPPAIRRRFSKRLDDGKTATYTGKIDLCRMSRTGWCLSQLLRVVGGPLPISTDTDVPATVAVTEDAATKGQFWTRIYGRKRGFPFVVQSSKRFRGVTGLEEYVGYGLGMALSIAATDMALHFHSHHYFLEIRKWRLRLPKWLTPGALTVSHINRDDNCFEFVLHLHHPWLGELVHQRAVFVECRQLS